MTSELGIDTTLVLIGCAKTKLTIPAPARELYSPSQLFVARRRYAERSGHPWMILSALHGAVDPDKSLDPYDFTIADMLRPGSKIEPWSWASSVIRTAMARTGANRQVTLEVHAGIDYVRTLRRAAERYTGWFVDIIHPVEGLGIGEQKAWYAGVRTLL